LSIKLVAVSDDKRFKQEIKQNNVIADNLDSSEVIKEKRQRRGNEEKINMLKELIAANPDMRAGDFAIKLGVSKQTIWNWIKNDKIPYKKKKTRMSSVIVSGDKIAEIQGIINANPELILEDVSKKSGIPYHALYKLFKKGRIIYTSKSPASKNKTLHNPEREGKESVVKTEAEHVEETVPEKINVPVKSNPIVVAEKPTQVKQQDCLDNNIKLIDEATERQLVDIIHRALEVDYVGTYDDVARIDKEFSAIRDKKIAVKTSGNGVWVLKGFNGANNISFDRLSAGAWYKIFPFKELGRTFIVFENFHKPEVIRFSIWKRRGSYDINTNFELKTGSLAAAIAYERMRTREK
jgi:predicted site-specific integrase-resolvase